VTAGLLDLLGCDCIPDQPTPTDQPQFNQTAPIRRTQYLAKWPEYCQMAEAPGQQAMGYILGKAEGEGTSWHGHVTAVTVAPDFRWVGGTKAGRPELPGLANAPTQRLGSHLH
jgi:hypothetical protein